MMHMRAGFGLAVCAVLLAAPRVGAAQASCHLRLSAHMTLPRSQHFSPSVDITDLASRFAEVTWRMVLMRRPLGRGTGNLFFGGTGDSAAVDRMAVALKPRRGDDGVAAERAAHALAEIMRGERTGYTTEQAVLAAHIYRWWGLPPQQALGVLLDATASMRTRRLAVNALHRYWEEPGFAAAGLVAFCAVVDRASGLGGQPNSEGSDAVDSLLNDDELELLGTLVISLSHVREIAPGHALHLQDLVPPDNPVAAYLQRVAPSP